MLGIPWSTGKESTCSAGDLGLIPGLRRSPGEGNSYPLQYSGLENSMNYNGVAKSWTQLTFTFTSHVLDTGYPLYMGYVNFYHNSQISLFSPSFYK